MAKHPGVYCLHSNILDWDAERMRRTCMTLTKVEAVFRCLKSELELRPVYHQKSRRTEGHLFISVLAPETLPFPASRWSLSSKKWELYTIVAEGINEKGRSLCRPLVWLGRVG